METRAVQIQQLYQHFTTLPHRDLAPVIAVMQRGLDELPMDAAQTLVWLAEKSAIRDLVDAAVIALLKSNPDHPFRQAGRCILMGETIYPDRISPPGVWQGLPPFRILRVLEQLVTGQPKTTRLATKLFSEFLYSLEGDPGRADYVVAQNRSAIQRLWRDRHLRPDDFPTVYAFLHGEAPEGTINWAIRELGKIEGAIEKVIFGVQNKIPFRILLGLVPNRPETRIALIEAMSPQEALNSRAMLESAGVLQIPEVKEAFLAKVKKATRSVATIEQRKSTRGADADVNAAIAEARQTAAKQYAINGFVVIALDTSGSLREGIEYAPQVASIIFPAAQAGEGDVVICTFNTHARWVPLQEDSYDGVKRALSVYRADGGTDVGSVFELAQKTVEPSPAAYVFITDLDDVSHRFLQKYQAHAAHIGYQPRLVFVRVGSPTATDTITHELDRAGIPYDLLRYDGTDPYVLDQLPALLSGAAPQSIWEQIMGTEIPRLIHA